MLQFRHRRTLYTSACTAIAVLTAATVTAAAPAAAGAVTLPALLSAAPLGSTPRRGTTSTRRTRRRAAAWTSSSRCCRRPDIGLLRYGGGSYADYYDWQTNTDIQTCIWGNPFGSFTGAPFPYDTTAPFTGASCDSTDSLPFDQFSAQAKAIGAQSFVTVNYGSGTPAEAAAWVSHSRSTPGDSVALWEVGNENYGCWEVNNWLAQAPENFQGYKPNNYTTVNGVYENPTCPQMTQGNAAGDPDARHVLRGQRPEVPGRDEAGRPGGPDRRALGLRQRRGGRVRAGQHRVERHGARPGRPVRQLRRRPLLPVLLRRGHRRQQPDRPAGPAVPDVGARAVPRRSAANSTPMTPRPRSSSARRACPTTRRPPCAPRPGRCSPPATCCPGSRPGRRASTGGT